MDKDFMQYVYSRCEEALINNAEYMKLEREKADPDEIQSRAEELCYIQGFRDSMRIFMTGR